MQDTTPYVMTREGEQWLFRPSGLFAALLITGFFAGSGFCGYLAWTFFAKANDALTIGFAAIFLFAAGLLAALGVWAWRTRRTPLIIQSDGRVCYGKRELCAAGMVRSVRIVPSPGGERGDCEACLELEGGTLVRLPSQYFGGLSSPDLVRPFATALAGALNVCVTE